jgi:hypothetical protein
MRPVGNAVLVVLIVATGGSLLVVAVAKVREAAGRVQCENNLRRLGLDLGTYQDCNGRYPPAAIPNADLLPENRLSWLVAILPFVEADDTYSRMTKDKGWDAPENRFAAELTCKCFLCPSYPAGPAVSTLSPTHYVGISGIGEDAASLLTGDPRAGFFGYERTVRKNDLARGASETAVAAETAWAQGAWTAAGPATVRGVEAGTSPAGPPTGFGGNHRGVCLVLFADASVRPIDASLSGAEWARMIVLKAEKSDE